MGITITTKQIRSGTERQRIFNHTSRSGTTVHGKTAIIIGAVFFGAGIPIAMVGAGWLDPDGANAPPIVLYCAGAVFSLPGVWLMGYGVQSILRRRWVDHQMHQFPTEPWQYDYPWNQQAAQYTDWKPLIYSLFFLSVVGAMPKFRRPTEPGAPALPGLGDFLGRLHRSNQTGNPRYQDRTARYGY